MAEQGQEAGEEADGCTHSASGQRTPETKGRLISEQMRKETAPRSELSGERKNQNERVSPQEKEMQLAVIVASLGKVKMPPGCVMGDDK